MDSKLCSSWHVPGRVAYRDDTSPVGAPQGPPCIRAGASGASGAGDPACGGPGRIACFYTPFTPNRGEAADFLSCSDFLIAPRPMTDKGRSDNVAARGSGRIPGTGKGEYPLVPGCGERPQARRASCRAPTLSSMGLTQLRIRSASVSCRSMRRADARQGPNEAL